MSALTTSLLPYLAALVAALGGSLHCAVMCGPLRLLSTQNPGSSWKYQAGRGLAYGILGCIAGGLGFVLPLWALLFVVGIGLLGSVLPSPALPRWQKLRRRALLAGSASPFFLGLSSGLLPCGLLHGWVAAAAATAHPLSGAILLGLLWAGSLPALELGPAIFGKSLTGLNQRHPNLVKVALVLVALVPLFLRIPTVAATPSTPPAHCHDHAAP